jgi:diguanylate cyclase (GGDEF)-like protein
MRRSRITSRELLERLVPVDSLDGEGLALYRSLMACDDEAEVLRGIAVLLERLSGMGYLRRLSRRQTNGVTQATYRNLATLDTIRIALPSQAGWPATAGGPGQRATDGNGRDKEADGPQSGAQEAGGQIDGPRVLPRPIMDAVAASSRRIDLAGAVNYLHELLEGTVGCDRGAIFMSKGLSNSSPGRLSELEDVFRWSEREMMSPSELRTRVEETGKTAHIPDLSAGRYSRHLPEGTTGSLLVAPLRAEAYVYGVLEVWSRRPRAFSSDDVAIVDFVAEFMGGLIKRRLEVEELIFVDQTSQIHNRRYFDEQLVREIERCRRTGNPMALLIGDIDDFKQVNDTMGHAAGDSVLRQVGRILTENARQLDIVARYGGEEFAVILPSVTRGTALAVAERMRSTVARHRFITGTDVRPTCDLTISFGGALHPLDAKSKTDLIDKADRIALYEAKRQGKNRVVFWHDMKTI